ncbi:butyrate kinase [Odoribacter lunatus]|uniref:butyrate kinase n=1 Tax=Odoribacter lunatus TaxID=2941335 RepID=UPI00203BB600|nr:butyrate kinase [Odoribacter lunatus]
MIYRILAINPGSTSTKIALFENENQVFIKTIRHSAEEIGKFANISSQFTFRKELIQKELQEAGIALETIHAIVGRGGLIKPIESGVYEVNTAMIQDMQTPVMGEHASNLGGLIAHEIAKEAGSQVKAYIADPVVVDELNPIARISGHPAFPRVSIFHALNQKSIARTYAKAIGKKYEELNLVIAHLGGGISVSAHHYGKVIDTNNALNGDGPFSPERAGGVPVGALVKLCFSGTKTQDEVKKMLCGAGGLVGYLNSNDVIEIEKNALSDSHYQLIWEAMCYQVAKEIGAMACVLEGQVDAILLTGGIANSKKVTQAITQRVQFIAPVKVYPGEDEMRALALNGLMVMKGELAPKVYA